MLEKIVVRFLLVVYSKPEDSAGRWTAVHCFGLSPKMPIFKLLNKSWGIEAQGSLLAIVKSGVFS